MELSLCNFCSWPTNLSEVSIEVENLKVENANLKREIDQLEAFFSGPVQFPVGPSAAQLSSSSMILLMKHISKLLDIANAAMNELVMLGQLDCPFWRNNSGSNRETLNYEEYKSVFNNGRKPPGCVIESSKDTGLVLMTSYDLVETLMNTNKWVDVFAPIVPVATSRKVNGSLHLIQAEFIVPSPLVPKRKVMFLRYCKLLRNGVWAVVDVTPTQQTPNLLSYGSRRLPSGLIIEDMGNGYSMVTWIEQTAYDESHIHQLYRPLIGSGIGLGAKRWLKTLQRHCQILSFMWTINLAEEYSGMPAKVRAEIVKLAQRMTLGYSLGLSDCAVSKWESIQVGNARGNMRLMIRKNVNEPREMTGIVLSAATSVWFPVNQQKMFDFLSNHNFRNQWDILTRNTSIEEKVRIQIANRHGNFVSILQIAGNDMLVLQEIWNDASGAFVVYAPMGTNSLDEVMKGADSGFVQILSSGFSILPDRETSGGCLLTLGLQVLVSSKPTSELSPSIVETVEKLLDSTIRKIRSGLRRET